MILKDKVAVVYGAGGAIGGAVARAFANEGARLFLTGRDRAPVETVASEILSTGGSAHAAAVDALDERAIDEHLQFVVDAAGRVDISFNAIGIAPSSISGMLLDIDREQFVRSIAGYTTSYFLTARLAARRMVPNKSGVIMSVSALPARVATAGNGGYGPAMAAKEALTRDLSLALAPQGIRVVGLRPHGFPETRTMTEVFEMRAKTSDITRDRFFALLASRSHTQRAMQIAELADVAAFVASDKASGLTGTTINLTMGGVAD